MTKTEFNSKFALSFDGKFKGLDVIENLPLFWHKLSRLISRYERTCGVPDRLDMRLSGHSVKLYIR